MRRNEVYHEIKIEEEMKADADRFVGIIYAVRITAAKFGKRQRGNDGKNKCIFLWKIRECRCRFKN